MPRPNKPFLRPDGRWETTFKGKAIYGYSLSEVLQKLTAAQTGRGAAPAPDSLSALRHRWLAEHPGRNNEDRSLRFVAWAGLAERVADLPTDTLILYAAALRKQQVATHTLITYVGTAKSLLYMAHQRGWTDRPQLPAKLPPMPRTPRPLSAAELVSIIYTLDAMPRGKRVAAIVRFILATGCRPGEACALRWEMFTGRAFVLEQHKTATATGAPRIIPLSAEAMSLLPERQAAGPVFVSRLKRPFTPAGIRSSFARAAVKVLGERRSVYQLRHTFATRARDVLAMDQLQLAL